MSSTESVRLSSLVESRFSPRSFAETALSEEQINLLFEAALRAPSAGNQQPWRFVFVDKHTQPEQFEALVGTLTGNNLRWAHTAPLLVVSIAKELNDKGLPHGPARYDLGQSVAWMTVQATDMGLFVHQMGGFQHDQVRELLEIPEGFAPVTVSAIGYKGEPEGIPEDLRLSETNRMPRRPASELVFRGTFQAQNAEPILKS